MPRTHLHHRGDRRITGRVFFEVETMSAVGALIVTFAALLVGLGAMAMAWRFVMKIQPRKPGDDGPRRVYNRN